MIAKVFAGLATGSVLVGMLLWGAVMLIDQHRAHHAGRLFEACRLCMGSSWGQPDEPQPTVAQYEECCPDVPDAVMTDCARAAERVCELFLDDDTCWGIAAPTCLAVFPPIAWQPVEVR